MLFSLESLYPQCYTDFCVLKLNFLSFHCMQFILKGYDDIGRFGSCSMVKEAHYPHEDCGHQE